MLIGTVKLPMFASGKGRMPPAVSNYLTTATKPCASVFPEVQGETNGEEDKEEGCRPEDRNETEADDCKEDLEVSDQTDSCQEDLEVSGQTDSCQKDLEAGDQTDCCEEGRKEDFEIACKAARQRQAWNDGRWH